jgi:hypothetical protein
MAIDPNKIELGRRLLRENFQQQAQSKNQQINPENIEKGRALLRSEFQGQTPQSPAPQEPSFSYLKFIADSLAKGTISITDLPSNIVSLLSLGNINLGLPSEAIKGGIGKLGYNLDSEVPTTADQRILGHAAEFGGGMLGGAGLGAAAKAIGAAKNLPLLKKAGNFLGAPTANTGLGKASQLAKLTGTGAGIGAVSGVAQEMGANPLAADIGSALLSPLAGNALLKTGKTIFSPAKTIKSMQQKAAGQELAKAIGPDNVGQAVHNVQEYKPPITGYEPSVAEMAQSVGLSQLHRSRMGSLPELAMQEARGNEALRGNIEKVRAEPKALEEFQYQPKAEVAGESVRDALLQRKTALEKTRAEAAKAPYEDLYAMDKKIYPQKTMDLIEEMRGIAKGPFAQNLDYIQNKLLYPKGFKVPPDLKKYSPEARNQYLSEVLADTPGRIKESMKVIGDMAEQAKRSGAKERSRSLMQIKKSLVDDLTGTPQAAADAIYAQYSQEVNNLDRNKRLGKAVKKDIFNKEFMTDKGEVAQKVINKSMTSDEYADAILKHVGDNEKAMKDIRGYINRDLMDTIDAKSGRINLNQLASWRKTNEAANKLYPGLPEKLDAMQRKALTDELGHYVGKGTMDANQKNMVTYDKISKFLSSNKKFIEEVFTPEEVKFLKDVEGVLRGRHAVVSVGKAVGSPTAANQTILQAIYSKSPDLIMKAVGSKLGSLAHGTFKTLNKAKINELVDKALTDKDLFNLLMTPLKDVKPTKTFADRLRGASKVMAKAGVRAAVGTNKKNLMNITLNYNEPKEQ